MLRSVAALSVYASNELSKSGRDLIKQLSYWIALAVLPVVALCAGCENSDRANSPVSIAISRFLKLFIVKDRFF